MHIQIDASGDRILTSLTEPGDFTAFDVHLIEGAPEALHTTLAALGRVDDNAEHVWVEPVLVIEVAGAHANDDRWREKFEAMVIYAQSKGWVDGSGAIRAHVERLPSAA
jgi:hypothetical protein